MTDSANSTEENGTSEIHPSKKARYILGICLFLQASSVLTMLYYTMEDRTPILYVASLACAGAVVHTIGSFATHVGKGTLCLKWFWWYLLHPLRAALLGLVVSVVLTDDDLIIALSGLCSQAVVDRLKSNLQERETS